jgi:hypothetical protein
MAIDRAGKKLYVNLTGVDKVGVVDLDARQMVAEWPVPDAHVENSMALDEPNHRLFVATRQPAKFFVYSTDTGKVVTVLPCAGVNDDMWFDTARKRIYVTGSDTTSVFEQAGRRPLPAPRGGPDGISREDIGVCAVAEPALCGGVSQGQAGRKDVAADL